MHLPVASRTFASISDMFMTTARLPKHQHSGSACREITLLEEEEMCAPSARWQDGLGANTPS